MEVRGRQTDLSQTDRQYEWSDGWSKGRANRQTCTVKVEVWWRNTKANKNGMKMKKIKFLFCQHFSIKVFLFLWLACVCVGVGWGWVNFVIAYFVVVVFFLLLSLVGWFVCVCGGGGGGGLLLLLLLASVFFSFLLVRKLFGKQVWFSLLTNKSEKFSCSEILIRPASHTLLNCPHWMHWEWECSRNQRSVL